MSFHYKHVKTVSSFWTLFWCLPLVILVMEVWRPALQDELKSLLEHQQQRQKPVSFNPFSFQYPFWQPSQFPFSSPMHSGPTHEDSVPPVHKGSTPPTHKILPPPTIRSLFLSLVKDPMNTVKDCWVLSTVTTVTTRILKNLNLKNWVGIDHCYKK